MKSRLRIRAFRVTIFVATVLLWEGIGALPRVPDYILPRFSEVVLRILERPVSILHHFLVTASEAVAGFLLGTVVGMVLAAALTFAPSLREAVFPYAIGLKSMPVIAIAPLLTVWFGNGLAPKIIVASIISFFPVLVNMSKGLERVDREAVDVLRSLAATNLQIFIKLRLPSSLPYLAAALKVSATLAAIGAIVGEFAGADKGLGFLIVVSAHRLDTAGMFVGIVLSTLLGIGLFYLMHGVEKMISPWSATTDPL